MTVFQPECWQYQINEMHVRFSLKFTWVVVNTNFTIHSSGLTRCFVSVGCLLQALAFNNLLHECHMFSMQKIQWLALFSCCPLRIQGLGFPVLFLHFASLTCCKMQKQHGKLQAVHIVVGCCCMLLLAAGVASFPVAWHFPSITVASATQLITPWPWRCHGHANIPYNHINGTACKNLC